MTFMDKLNELMQYLVTRKKVANNHNLVGNYPCIPFLKDIDFLECVKKIMDLTKLIHTKNSNSLNHAWIRNLLA